jgi:hypothetical protein
MEKRTRGQHRRTPTSQLTSIRLQLYLDLEDGKLRNAAVGEVEDNPTTVA